MITLNIGTTNERQILNDVMEFLKIKEKQVKQKLQNSSKNKICKNYENIV